MRKRFTSLFCLIPAAILSVANAQVANNDINNRSELVLDAGWVHSTTSNNSVEWRCVNKALTRKCLVYHNDQWFHFTPVRNGEFFLNISSQECRKSEGVQLVVIEGNPCEIGTYRILACIPKIDREDVFLELDSLKANIQYLINVDGFLGDFCEFDIELSSKPKGFPQNSPPSDTVTLSTRLDVNLVRLEWRVNQLTAQELQRFEIFVRKEGKPKSKPVAHVQVQSNALGSRVEEYSITDTLRTEGEYQYQIVGVTQKDMRRVLSKRRVSFKPKVELPREIKVAVPVSFGNQNPGRLEVFIFNPVDGEMIGYSAHDYENPKTLSIDLAKFVNAGIRHFQIKVRHNKISNNKVFDFQLNESGDVERVMKN